MTTFTIDESIHTTLPTHFQTFDIMMDTLMGEYLDFHELTLDEITPDIHRKHEASKNIPRFAYLNA